MQASTQTVCRYITFQIIEVTFLWRSFLWEKNVARVHILPSETE